MRSSHDCMIALYALPPPRGAGLHLPIHVSFVLLIALFLFLWFAEPR